MISFWITFDKYVAYCMPWTYIYCLGLLSVKVVLLNVAQIVQVTQQMPF